MAVDAPEVAGADAAACRALLDDLPGTLAGQDRREVEPPDAAAAAWGDPAIVLTCGVPRPDLDQFAPCLEANGVGWFVESEDESDPEAPATVTAAGYEPTVRVEIPSDRQPEGVASVTAGLAAVVEEHLELVDPCA
ncbi:DUF3515 family protein [Nocardioides sp. GCM10027113]|uniref:DUF3515 family protein n=1 Tax=unclassified Nocardioides TaxID=2615069 RepID=UPI00360DF35F